jgi:hypothetical protein
MSKSKSKMNPSLRIVLQRISAIAVRSIPTRFSSVFNFAGCLAMCYLLVTAISFVSRNNNDNQSVETNEIVYKLMNITLQLSFQRFQSKSGRYSDSGRNRGYKERDGIATENNFILDSLL